MATVSAAIPTVTGGTTKAHADAEKLCEDATYNSLEAENYGPRVSGCHLPSGFIRGDGHGGLGGFPHFWAGPLSEGRAAWVCVSVSRKFDAQGVAACGGRDGYEKRFSQLHSSPKKKSADATARLYGAGHISLHAANVLQELVFFRHQAFGVRSSVKVYWLVLTASR